MNIQELQKNTSRLIEDSVRQMLSIRAHQARYHLFRAVLLKVCPHCKETLIKDIKKDDFDLHQAIKGLPK